jgi:hypothetical protein
MLKPLETRTTKEKKQRTRNLIIGLIIAALMIFSTIGYALIDRAPPEEAKVYNNFTFAQGQYGWETTVQGRKIITSYLPQNTLNISSNPNNFSLADIEGKTIYVLISNQSSRYLFADFFTNLNDIALRMQFACPKEAENTSFCKETNLPIKTCEDSDATSRIIILKEANQTSYNYKDGCLIFEGQGSSIIKATDNLIFRLFGVIK